MTEPVDWALAQATGVRTAPSGPHISPVQAAHTVSALAQSAAAARAPVADITRLSVAETDPAVIVDRPEWVRSNTQSLRSVLAVAPHPASPSTVHNLTSKANAIQLGLVLGWMSGKVLGQYEVLTLADSPQRLLLVAPNLVSAGRALGLTDQRDFFLWVCLHEETHRVQFTAFPWLTEFLRDAMTTLVADLDVGPGELSARITTAIRSPDRGSPMGWVQSPEVRALMLKVLALMSLLEGHADWVMDQSEQVVASARELRVAFDRRRRPAGLLDLVLRRALGLEAKMAQYREGAAFVRAVVAAVGVSGLNRVWESAETLPSMTEINDPGAWVRRVAAA